MSRPLLAALGSLISDLDGPPPSELLWKIVKGPGGVKLGLFRLAVGWVEPLPLRLTSGSTGAAAPVVTSAPGGIGGPGSRLFCRAWPWRVSCSGAIKGGDELISTCTASGGASRKVPQLSVPA